MLNTLISALETTGKRANQKYFQCTTRKFMKTLDHRSDITFNNEKHKTVAWMCSVKKVFFKIPQN